MSEYNGLESFGVDSNRKQEVGAKHTVDILRDPTIDPQEIPLSTANYDNHVYPDEKLAIMAKSDEGVDEYTDDEEQPQSESDDAGTEVERPKLKAKAKRADDRRGKPRRTGDGNKQRTVQVRLHINLQLKFALNAKKDVAVMLRNKGFAQQKLNIS
ncbi:hypothetical protein F5884DRAFT_873957 [Xylogone sp. PMI_703]|nr:hypothetical protein F5884DRAFT_873957 [Xylogone sp. PMI_703]